MPKKQRVPAHVKEGLRKQTVKGQIHEPDLAKLVTHFFDVAGGERNVAKMLYDEFQNAREGSVVRQRILDMILRGTRYLNEKSRPTDDLGSLSEDDLDRELAELIEAAQEGQALPGQGAEVPCGEEEGSEEDHGGEPSTTATPAEEGAFGPVPAEGDPVCGTDSGEGEHPRGDSDTRGSDSATGTEGDSA